ncbi:hypothetical protein G6L45_16095 [Agrobacterium rhizogenes]|nr:hypothetical protein [Rhizobium rhizogenes]NTH97006.1 hypothetical protein [Rhizobium rhizogenes]NTJ15192.1 hypothetical protein [Rhizobium rhizogenes]
MQFLCGKCKNFFANEPAISSHINAKHTGHRVSVYQAVKAIDLREDNEPSFADRAIEASLAIAMGEPTDDAWLLGE